MAEHITKKLEERIKKLQSNKKPETQDEICKYINSFGFNITPEKISFSGGVIYLKKISPIHRVKIRLKKRAIIKSCAENNITIRDII